MTQRVFAGAAAATLMLLTACGGGGQDTVQKAEAKFVAARSGSVKFQLAAQAEGTQPVGFGIEGAYAFEKGKTYPLLDILYSRFPSPEAPAHILSTGDEVFAGRGDELRAVDQERAAIFEEIQRDGAFLRFGFSQWLVDPTESVDGSLRITTGQVDVVNLLSDLARGAVQFADASDLQSPDPESARRLRRVVKSSEMTVVTDATTGAFRSLQVLVEFEADAAEELRAALGQFAGVRLEVALNFAPLAERLRPTAPAGAATNGS